MSFGTLFTYTPNARILKILAAAHVNGLNIDIAPDFQMGTTNQHAEFLAKFPLGKVPAFEGSDVGNGSTVLFESDAIAQYVAESGPLRETLLGNDVRERAVIRQWICFSENEIMGPVMQLVMWRVGMAPFDAAVENNAMAALRRGLGCVEGHLAGRGKERWLAVDGEQPSLADFSLAGACYWGFMQIIDKGMRDEFPNVTQWYRRVLASEDVFDGATLIEERLDFQAN